MTRWVRSSACAAGDCIEARQSDTEPNVIVLRHGRPGIIFGGFRVTSAGWDAFIAGVKNGDFDQLTGDAT